MTYDELTVFDQFEIFRGRLKTVESALCNLELDLILLQGTPDEEKNKEAVQAELDVLLVVRDKLVTLINLAKSKIA